MEDRKIKRKNKMETQNLKMAKLKQTIFTIRMIKMHDESLVQIVTYFQGLY